MSLFRSHNIKVFGSGDKTLVFAHGYGCDQTMWRFVASVFQQEYRVVLFDHIGAGGSDLAQYRREKYSTLNGYVTDVLQIIEAVGEPVIFVGHSVSAMIGVLAAIEKPSAFDRLILIGPSACYVNSGDYEGGFNKADIEALIQTLDENHLGWSHAMAPVIMKNPDRPELASELAESFCRTDPEIAKHFARVTFLSDNRKDLALLKTPALVLQCSDDSIAPEAVGRFLHQHLAGSTFLKLKATGHCPHLSGPLETIQAMKAYLARP